MVGCATAVDGLVFDWERKAEMGKTEIGNTSMISRFLSNISGRYHIMSALGAISVASIRRALPSFIVMGKGKFQVRSL